MATVGEIYDFIDSIVPFSLCEKGDNSGLLTGERNKKADKILITLDITNEVVREAAQCDAQLIVSHHPVIYHPIYTISNDNPAVALSKYGISAICAHTNLDAVSGGLSDIMIKMLGLKPLTQILEISHEEPYYQLAVFVPEKSRESVYNAMTAAGAGTLGNYSGCAFYSVGTGMFLPLDGAKPFVGEVGRRETVCEARLEMIVPPLKRQAVIQAMLDAHPYEKPAYHLAKNYAIMERNGFGRMGELEAPVNAKRLAETIKKAFGNTVVRFNDTKKPIKRVAVCSGGGGGLFREALSLGADAYITGDVKHDQFVDAHNFGLSVFDAGHYHTENIAVDFFAERLSLRFPDASVIRTKANHDPVCYEI